MNPKNAKEHTHILLTYIFLKQRLMEFAFLTTEFRGNQLPNPAAVDVYFASTMFLYIFFS